MSVKFSPNARTGVEKQKYFDEVEEWYKEAAALRVAQIDPQTFSPVAKVPVKVLVLLQSGLRRVLELTGAFVNEVNAGLFTPPFVTARAALETSCLLYSVTEDVERIVHAHDLPALEEFDKKMMRALLGGKSRVWTHADEYEALNVLTIIDHLTEKMMPKLREMYDLLSEYAHPNYDSMIGVYQRVIRQTEGAKFIDHPAPQFPEALNTAVGMAGFALHLTERAVARYQAILSKFVSLCEEAIQKGGTWPAEMPYPRQP
jgi:hypothetical protein